jgi:hypothetical protein
MKTPLKTGHVNDDLRRTNFSEGKQLNAIYELQRRSSAEKYKKTPEEREAVKVAMYNYPTKHGAPDSLYNLKVSKAWQQ